MTWDLAEAKDRLSEVVDLALSEGPQTITRGDDAVVVLSSARYEELTGKRPSSKEFPFRGIGPDGLDPTRDGRPGRDVEL